VLTNYTARAKLRDRLEYSRESELAHGTVEWAIRNQPNNFRFLTFLILVILCQFIFIC
jgi:hypothetical protein